MISIANFNSYNDVINSMKCFKTEVNVNDQYCQL